MLLFPCSFDPASHADCPLPQQVHVRPRPSPRLLTLRVGTEAAQWTPMHAHTQPACPTILPNSTLPTTCLLCLTIPYLCPALPTTCLASVLHLPCFLLPQHAHRIPSRASCRKEQRRRGGRSKEMKGRL